MKRLAAVLLSALFCSAVALCQDTAPVTTGTGLVHTGIMGFGLLSRSLPVVTGAPYSGEEFEEVDQTLPDGTHIRRQAPLGKKYRDAMGRTRLDQPIRRPRSEGAEERLLIHIDDPVAHVRYILDPDRKMAYRSALVTRDARPSSSRSGMVYATSDGTIQIGSSSPKAEVAADSGVSPRVQARASLTTDHAGVDDVGQSKGTMENLGTQTIEGVVVNGHRMTRIWPVGLVGNDRPFTTTQEFWLSSELRIEILGIQDDPRTGERTHKLINISRDEPDAALFQVPPDYTVKDEKEDFAIGRSAPPR